MRRGERLARIKKDEKKKASHLKEAKTKKREQRGFGQCKRT